MEARPEQHDGERPGPVRVLVVDDHEMFATSLAHALQQEPDLEVVATAPTLRSARSQMTVQRPDVVLLDHRLPDGRGADAIAALRRLVPDVRVVILTAELDDAALITATEAGCSGFVLKTSGLDELVNAVRAAAAGEMLVSPSLLPRLLAGVHRNRPGGSTVLTAREREILGLIAEGMSNAAIASHLTLSVNTVRNHVQNVLAKLGVHSKLEALAVAVREGIVHPDGGAEP